MLDAVEIIENVRLRDTGISTRPDQEEAFAAYMALRTEWHSYIYQLAPSMMYTMEEVEEAMNS